MSEGSYTPPPPPPPPYHGGGGDIIYPSNPPKDPILILLLNLVLLGGVGYLVLGQTVKGVLAIVTALVVTIPTCGLGALLVGAFGAVDGYLQAEQLKAGHPIGLWTFFSDHK